ncbi:MAG TPA: Uma2 family endonuclease [Pyrinomonadaceae bacterium]|jgi:Uma2 family endonuclease
MIPSATAKRGSKLYVGSLVDPIEVNFPLLKKMSEDDFYKFCEENPDLRIERTKEGDVIVMPPAYTETGGKNFDLAVDFGIWARQDATGKGFDSSTGFTLPNGAMRSPDVSWVRYERWNALPKEKRRKFAKIAPDFVIELRSETDRLKDLQKKMREYIENGVQLGWLIDPQNKRVHIYRPKTETKVLENPKEVSGEPLLKGFVLNLQEIWD